MRATLSFLLFGGLWLAPAAAEPEKFDWFKFGQEIRQGMPKEIKDAGPLRQVHHVAEQVADKLWALGVPPNYDENGRSRSRQKFNDTHIGTCGHSTLCLNTAWRGAGLADKAAKSALVLKRKPDGQLRPEINSDHVALVFLDPDGPVVFDLWCHGRSKKTFAQFNTSVWKGMPLSEWARRMDGEGYNFASCQEHPELGETPPLQLPQLIRKISPSGFKSTTGQN